MGDESRGTKDWYCGVWSREYILRKVPRGESHSGCLSCTPNTWINGLEDKPHRGDLCQAAKDVAVDVVYLQTPRAFIDIRVIDLNRCKDRNPGGSQIFPSKNQMAFAGVTTVQALHLDDETAIKARDPDAARLSGILSWHGCMDLRKSNLNMHQTQKRLHAALDLETPCGTEDTGVFLVHKDGGFDSPDNTYIERDYANSRLGGTYSLEEKWRRRTPCDVYDYEADDEDECNNSCDTRCLAIVRRVGWDGSVAGAKGVKRDDPMFLSAKPPDDVLRDETHDQRRASMFIVVGDFWSFADCRCDGEYGMESTNYITGRIRQGRYCYRHDAKKNEVYKSVRRHMFFDITHRIGAGVLSTKWTTSQYDTRETCQPMLGGFVDQTPSEENVSGLLFSLPGEMHEYEPISALTESSIPAECVDQNGNARYFKWPPAKNELPGLVFRGSAAASAVAPPSGAGFLKENKANMFYNNQRGRVSDAIIDQNPRIFRFSAVNKDTVYGPDQPFDDGSFRYSDPQYDAEDTDDDDDDANDEETEEKEKESPRPARKKSSAPLNSGIECPV